jgi:hypothetical protein
VYILEARLPNIIFHARVDEELILGKGARECLIPLRNRGIRQDAVIGGDDVRRVFYLLNISALLRRSEAPDVEFGAVNNAPIRASYVNEIKLFFKVHSLLQSSSSKLR